MQRGADRLAATPGDVEVRRLAALPVGDRVHVVGRERTEHGDRDRHPDDRAEHDVGEVVDAEVDPQRADDRDGAGRGDLRPEPRPTGNDEHEGHADRQERHHADRDRRRRVALPARQLPHAERPRSQREELEPLQERSDDAQGDDPDHELPPAAEPPGRQHDERTERREPDARADGVHLARERVEPPGAGPDDGVGGPRVEPVERARMDADPPTAGDDDGHQQDQPDPAGGTDLLGQRRGGARRPATSMDGDPRIGRRTHHLVLLIHAPPPRGSSHDRPRRWDRPLPQPPVLDGLVSAQGRGPLRGIGCRCHVPHRPREGGVHATDGC